MCSSSFTMIRWTFLCSCCWPKLTSKKPHTAVLATAQYSIYFQDHGGMWSPTTKAIKKSSEKLKLPSLTKVFKLISWWTMKWIITFIHFIHSPLKVSLKSTTLCWHTSNWNYHHFPKPLQSCHSLGGIERGKCKIIPFFLIGIDAQKPSRNASLASFPHPWSSLKNWRSCLKAEVLCVFTSFCQSQLVKIRHKGLQFKVFQTFVFHTKYGSLQSVQTIVPDKTKAWAIANWLSQLKCWDKVGRKW